MHLVGPLGFLPTLRFDEAIPFCDMGITHLPDHWALSRASMPPVTPWALHNPQVLAGWHNPAPILNESL